MLTAGLILATISLSTQLHFENFWVWVIRPTYMCISYMGGYYHMGTNFCGVKFSRFEGNGVNAGIFTGKNFRWYVKRMPVFFT